MRFNINKNTYNYIMENLIFNERKKEKEIFDLLVNGYTLNEISEQTKIPLRTICRRKVNILNKIKNIEEIKIQENNMSVYILIFPNKKVYIGQSVNPKQRWANGEGYKANKEMYNDIKKYGWENIEKKILYTNLTQREALIKENETIVLYKSYLEEYGYNKYITQ